jgi:hypothetical protein
LSNQIIARTTDIKPKVIFEWQTVQFLFLGHLREDLLLNHAKALRDAVEHRQVEQVNAGIDLVADEVGRLFHKGLHFSLRLGHDDPESARIFDSREHNGGLAAILLMEGLELLERIVADDVAVEDEKESLLVVLPQNLLCELEGAGRAQGDLLLGVGDFDVILLLERLEGVPDVVRLVVDCDDHFHHSDLRQGL